MKTEKIASRGVLFTFDELLEKYGCRTSVYVIVCPDCYYFCDTYLGESYIEKMKQHLEAEYGAKKYVAFNSHYDWDHIWGNAAFKTSNIVSSELTRTAIEKHGQEQLLENEADFAREEILIRLPELTFSDRLVFEKDGVEFFHSPGHTADSSSCYDRVGRILFVGDNVEDPLHYESTDDLGDYAQTLKHYLELDTSCIIASHGGVISKNFVKTTLDSIETLLLNKK
ncbi:MAG: MBL fold metallo-hydrolase [Negativicutes bacterium]|jgi:glyoxylase-like metal-dependent hydrolase (beta-lactamase superfamily II)